MVGEVVGRSEAVVETSAGSEGGCFGQRGGDGIERERWPPFVRSEEGKAVGPGGGLSGRRKVEGWLNNVGFFVRAVVRVWGMMMVSDRTRAHSTTHRP